MNIQKFTALKERAAEMQRAADRAAGERAQLLKRLKTEFGCESVRAARKLLQKLEREAADADQEFQKLLRDFEVEYDRH